MYTVDEVINNLPRPNIEELPNPPFSEGGNINGCNAGYRVGLAVASMKDHMTDEGYQIFQGLQWHGWMLQGYGFHSGHPELGDRTHVPTIINFLEPDTVLVQDKREWDLSRNDFRDPNAYFHEISSLRDRDDIFKLTILKDSHQRPFYHRDSAKEIDCHAWVVYYHPKIVKHLAPYVRSRHLIRTYHTVNSSSIPIFMPGRERKGCVLSGAVSGSYPLRVRLSREQHLIRCMDVIKHPGYHRNGCYTPSYLEMLNNYKVAICTASVFGYALRKLIEATACGCRVITDLPVDDRLPYIDDNLIRIHPSTPTSRIKDIVYEAIATYDEDRQMAFAGLAIANYDYKVQGYLLDRSIEHMRHNYA